VKWEKEAVVMASSLRSGLLRKKEWFKTLLTGEKGEIAISELLKLLYGN